MIKFFIALLILFVFAANGIAQTEKTIRIDKKYFNIPIQSSFECRRIGSKIGRKLHTYNDIRLADDKIDYWALLMFRKKTIKIDVEYNGQSFIQFNNSAQLNFSNNIIHPELTQTVIRWHSYRNCVINCNIISFGDRGNTITETGEYNSSF